MTRETRSERTACREGSPGTPTNFVLDSGVAPSSSRFSLDQYPFARLEPMRTLSNSDWDKLLGNTEPIVGPDLSSLLHAHIMHEGTQKLDPAGHEYGATPIVGTDRKKITETRVATRPTDPIPSRQASGEQACPVTSRDALRAEPRAATQMLRACQITGLRPPSGAPAASTSPLILRKTTIGKSTRAELFASVISDDKENQPANSSRSTALAKSAQPASKPSKATRNPGKQPVMHGRRSLDSAMPTAALLPVHRASNSARRFKDCSVDGCTKAARSRGFCKRHGGGKRCTFPDCPRSDQGGGLCIGHGGGKRCSVVDCKNSAQTRGLCKSHGGGRRCLGVDCTKSAQLGVFCRAHSRLADAKCAAHVHGLPSEAPHV